MVIATRAEISGLLRLDPMEDKMHFEIRRALCPGKQLTPAQRTSSVFAEEPRIGARTLRRGLPPLKLNEAQFAASLPQIKKLFLAGAIEISAVNHGDHSDLREAIAAWKRQSGKSDLQALHALLPQTLKFATNELEQLVQADDDAKKESVVDPPPPPKEPESSPPPEPRPPEDAKTGLDDGVGQEDATDVQGDQSADTVATSEGPSEGHVEGQPVRRGRHKQR